MGEPAELDRARTPFVDDEIAVQRARQRGRRPGSRDPESRQTIAARIVTSASGADRLLGAVASGVSSFSLVSDDGTVAVRVRLDVDAVQVSEEALGNSGAVVDWPRGRISNGESRVQLSRTELRLLAALVDRAGAPTTRAELVKQLWPRSEDSEKAGGLPVYVCGLRKRLAVVGLGSALQTLRGVGYRLVL